VRIIGGSHKGRRFDVPRSFNSRPTTDMARESLFNVLHNRYEFSSVNVIDLFAGTGAVSYEFASRGTEKITTVDNNYKLTGFLKQQSKAFSFDHINVIRRDVFQYLKGNVRMADIIFADPPFDLKNIETIPNLIFDNNWLNEKGCLILEHSKEFNFEKHPNYSFNKRYGAVNFSFFFEG